jgi:hypothetical protein
MRMHRDAVLVELTAMGCYESSYKSKEVRSQHASQILSIVDNVNEQLSLYDRKRQKQIDMIKFSSRFSQTEHDLLLLSSKNSGLFLVLYLIHLVESLSNIDIRTRLVETVSCRRRESLHAVIVVARYNSRVDGVSHCPICDARRRRRLQSNRPLDGRKILVVRQNEAVVLLNWRAVLLRRRLASRTFGFNDAIYLQASHQFVDRGVSSLVFSDRYQRFELRRAVEDRQ